MRSFPIHPWIAVVHAHDHLKTGAQRSYLRSGMPIVHIMLNFLPSTMVDTCNTKEQRPEQQAEEDQGKDEERTWISSGGARVGSGEKIEHRQSPSGSRPVPSASKMELQPSRRLFLKLKRAISSLRQLRRDSSI